MKQSQDRNNAELVFCQFSDQLLTPYDEVRNYYRRAYARMPGYHMPSHFMEIPFWIPVISGLLPAYNKRLHIVRDLRATADFMANQDEGIRFLFSAMDANVEQLKWLAGQTGAEIVAGGYVDSAEFDSLPNVRYLNDLGGLPGEFPDWDEGAADYELFRGQQVIPRLSLSTGCSYKCTFCTVPLQVLPTAAEQVIDEVAALEPLDFKLVFLDDKTFGQSPNWQSLDVIRDQIGAYNSDFEGFIVQTSPLNASRPDFMRACADLGVRYIEFGVEIVDDTYLKQMRKPFRARHLEAAMEYSADAGIPVIPNFIFGVKGASYEPTVEWVRGHLDQIPVVNGNWLAAQGDVRGGTSVLRGDEGVDMRNASDGDQNSTEKSWLTEAEQSESLDAFQAIQELTAPSTGARDMVPAPRGAITTLDISVVTR